MIIFSFQLVPDPLQYIAQNIYGEWYPIGYGGLE